MRHGAILLGHQGCEVSAFIQRSEVLLGSPRQQKEPEGETDLLSEWQQAEKKHVSSELDVR